MSARAAIPISGFIGADIFQIETLLSSDVLTIAAVIMKATALGDDCPSLSNSYSDVVPEDLSVEKVALVE